MARKITGSVIYQVDSNGVGATPYTGSLANHAAYLSAQNGASARFVFPGSRTDLHILWQAPGFSDIVTFYADIDGTPMAIGSINGADITTALGTNANSYLSIRSSVPFRSVVVSEQGDCCFEFSNISAW